jgi:hypothetical protein
VVGGVGGGVLVSRGGWLESQLIEIFATLSDSLLTVLV